MLATMQLLLKYMKFINTFPLQMHVHIKPLDQRLVSGLPLKPRKPRQPRLKEEGDNGLAIDLTGDDESPCDGYSDQGDFQASDAINKEIMQRAELLLRSENLARADALVRVANFRFDNSRPRSDNSQRFSQSDNLSRKDSIGSDGMLSPDTLFRPENLNRMIDMASNSASSMQRGDNLQQRADHLQRLIDSQHLHRSSSSLQRLAEEQASRTGNIQRLIEEQSARASSLERLAEEHRSDPLQRLLEQHQNSSLVTRPETVPQCGSLSETIDSGGRNKNVQSDIMCDPARVNIGGNHSSIDPNPYYRSSPYDISSRLSTGLHLPMRLPTTMSGFSQMGNSTSSAMSFPSPSQSIMGNVHSRTSSNQMSLCTSPTSSP